MSRRHLRRLLFLLLALGLPGAAAPALWRLAAEAWHKLMLRNAIPPSAGTLHTSLVYPLEGERWLEFTIPASAPRLKLLGNANLRSAARDQPQAHWRYTLHYQVLDAGGRVLKERHYHFETRLTQYPGDEKGRYYTAAYYQDGRIVPADGRLMMVNLNDVPAAARVRLRLAERQAEVASVAVRLYAPNKIADFRLPSLWQRLSPQKKDLLATGNIYAPALLNQAEQRNLLLNDWRPLGPVGIRGKDYEVVPMYILREIEDEPVYQDLFMLPGLPLDPGHDGVIAIPESGGEILLKPRHPTEQAGQAASLKLFWRGRSWKESGQTQIHWDGSETAELRQVVPGGWLRIEATTPLALQATLRTGSSSQDITPRPSYAKTYIAGSSQPLAYKIPDLNGLPIPLRLDLRPLAEADCLGDRQAITYPTGVGSLPLISNGIVPTLQRGNAASDAPASRAVSGQGCIPTLEHGNDQRTKRDAGASTAAPPRWSVGTINGWVRYNLPVALARVEFLDHRGRRIGLRELPVPFLPTRLDRRVGAPVEAVLSEPSQYYFELPETVAELRVTADAPLLVGAFDQVPGGFHSQRIPEDSYGDTDIAYWNPGWFMMPPEDVQALAEAGRMRLLTTQRRVEAVDPRLLQGQYRWQEFLPESSWRGDVLLVPEQPDQSPDELPDESLRPETLSGHFCRLLPGRETSLDLRGPTGLEYLTPTLAFERAGSEPFTLRLLADGEPLYQADHMGRRGLVELPPLPAGRRRLHLSAPAGSYRINYAAACADGPGWQRKLAFRLEGRATLWYDKRSADTETLSARLYTAAGDPRRSVVSAVVEAAPRPGLLPRSAWTFLRRRYDLRPGRLSGTTGLFGAAQDLTEGQLFSLPLNADLPPGRYRIHFTLEDGPAGWLALSTTQPGRFDRRHFLREGWPDAPVAAP